MIKIKAINVDKLLVFFSQGYGPLINFAIFKLLSDVLTVSEMGDYITIYALTFFFTAFIGLGYSFYMFKNLANDGSLVSVTWGKLLYLDLISIIISFPIYLMLSKLWVSDSVSTTTIILIFVTESLIVVLINDITVLYQSLQSFRIFSIIKVSFSTIRLMALLPISGGLIYFQDRLLGYYVISLLMLLLFYGVIYFYTGLRLSFPHFRGNQKLKGLSEGLLYSFGNFSKNAYNDVDKIMLSNMSGSYEAGLYGVIYKITTSIKLPLDTYLLITFPNYFKLSNRSIKHSYTFYIKKLKWYILFALLSICLAFVFVLLLPYLFPKYKDGGLLLMIFSTTFLLKALYMPLADILTSSGGQIIRTKLQVLVGVINIIFNLVLIKDFGMYGALYATMASELILLGLLVWQMRVSVNSRPV